MYRTRNIPHNSEDLFSYVCHTQPIIQKLWNMQMCQPISAVALDCEAGSLLDSINV